MLLFFLVFSVVEKYSQRKVYMDVKYCRTNENKVVLVRQVCVGG